ALIGSFLVRRAGLAVLGRFRAKMGQGRLPGRELSDGAAILVSGAFLISPGFITDMLGFLLLIPAVRHSIHRIISRRFSGRMTVVTANRRILRRERSGATGHVDGWGDDVVDVDADSSK
ncbi:MAG: FxsA family protein, partial [Acidimicrobiia bacterium]